MNKIMPPGTHVLRIDAPVDTVWTCCHCQETQLGTVPRTYVLTSDIPAYRDHVYCPPCARAHGIPDEKARGYWTIGGIPHD